MNFRFHRCMNAMIFMRMIFWPLVSLFVSVGSVIYSQPAETISIRPKILILNSYHLGYRFSDDVVQTFSQQIRLQIPHADIRIEYMDTKRYESSAHFKLFFDYLTQKYATDSFDLILVSDDAAFLFARNYQKNLWPGVPVVFTGVNNYNSEMLSDFPNFTGIVEKSDIEDNIRLIERLHPNAKQLYLILDNTITGEALRNSESAVIKQITQLKVHILDGGQMDLDELLKALDHLPKDAVVIYQLLLRDKSMHIFDHEDVIPLITQHSSVPVYGFADTYLNYGIVGGKMISGTEQGTVAADMAIRILSGTRPVDIPIQLNSHCVYKFDYRVLRRFHIPVKALPPESIIINRPVTFYERHRNVLWVAFGIFSIQLLLITYLTLNRRQLRKTQQALTQEHQLLQALMDNMPDLIYFKDRQSRIVRNNKAHLEAFGLEKQEDALGKTDFDFFPHEFAEEAYQDEQKIMETGVPLINKVEKVETGGKDPFWVSATKVPIRDDKGNVIALVGISRDITKSILDSEQIRASLSEKEILLKEIHHRVKNNLQIISSLLNLQISSISDKNVVDLLKESQHRIRSMALIHESLYRGQDLGNLNMKSYVHSLVNGLYQNYQGVTGRVEFHLDIQDVPIPIDLAVPCGLILNELVSNTLKHAFSDRKSSFDPKVDIRLNQDKKRWIHFTVIDNGKGMPPDFDWKNADSLGLKLVRILTESQLGGSLNVFNEKGTRVEISFPLEG